MRVIQDELNRVAKHWNLHRIRHQHNVECPSGRPDILFLVPELEGTSSYLHPVSEDEITAGKICCSSRRVDLLCLPEFADVAVEIMAEHKLELPSTPSEAKRLFLVLVQLLQHLM
ncbi:hypothetical protein ACROYT_G030113 [Oculina patagonica]